MGGHDPDQRLRRTYPYVADLPEHPGGWATTMTPTRLALRPGGMLGGRWYLLGCRLLCQRCRLCGVLRGVGVRTWIQESPTVREHRPRGMRTSLDWDIPKTLNHTTQG